MPDSDIPFMPERRYDHDHASPRLFHRPRSLPDRDGARGVRRRQTWPSA
jgi:hypothetical protein